MVTNDHRDLHPNLRGDSNRDGHSHRDRDRYERRAQHGDSDHSTDSDSDRDRDRHGDSGRDSYFNTGTHSNPALHGDRHNEPTPYSNTNGDRDGDADSNRHVGLRSDNGNWATFDLRSERYRRRTVGWRLRT